MPGIIVDEDDICLYITEKCNSNCIMCPMSLDSRKRGESFSLNDWDHFDEIIPYTPNHITITGGEPFLYYQKLIPLLGTINQLYPNTEILILTNGRALALQEVMEKLEPLITNQYRFAIPIHGPNETIHDRISASPGSFRQAIIALRNLSKTNATIEVRIVGHKLNIESINQTYGMLCDLGVRIDVINLIAMEMTGCAARNREHLWIDYSILCQEAKEGIKTALLHGINVGLYNFPLCQVPEGLWPMTKNSITPSKIRYCTECENCSKRDACGGLFYSTYELGLVTVKPYAKED